MKKILLIASLMMTFCLAYAQIGEVKTEGANAKIYNDKGRFTGKKIYLASTGFVKNVTNSAILIKEGAYVKYYDFEGRFTGNKTYEPR